MGQFQILQGITTDSSGNVHVDDHGSNRLQKFLDNGTFVTSLRMSGM